MISFVKSVKLRYKGIFKKSLHILYCNLSLGCQSIKLGEFSND